MTINKELEKKTDIELYTNFLNGDEESFNTIVKRYRQTLISFILGYVKQLDVAEDLAQDTFVYMLINKRNYNFKSSLKTYLFIIAKCRAINYIKRQKKSVAYDENYVLSIEDTLNLEEELLKEEKKKEIYFAIKKLKYEYQMAIYLKDLQDFEYKEICKILNKTMPQTKVLIHRARKALKKILKGE